MKAKVFLFFSAAFALVLNSPVFNSVAWADDDGPGRPHISDIGGDDHNPGVTLVIFIALVLIGFGVGLIVGRKTRRK